MKIKYFLTFILVIISCLFTNANDTIRKPVENSVTKDTVSDTVNRKLISNERIVVRLDTIYIDKPPVTNSKSAFTNILSSKITLFIIGLLLGALIVYFYSRHRIYKILTEEIKYNIEYKNIKEKSYLFNYIRLIEVLKMSKDNKKREIQRLTRTQAPNEDNFTNNQISSLDKFVQVNKENSDENVTNVELTEEKSSKEIFWNIAEDEKNKITEFFFSIPFEDGTFLDLHKSDIKEHNSFYKIKLIGNNIGELHFLTGEYDKTALDDISGYLSPVCNIENIDKRFTANRIIMKAPGEVLLSNGSWRINFNKKVKIELI